MAGQEVHVYNSKDTILTTGGLLLRKGLAEGDNAIEVAKDAEGAEFEVGTNADVIINQTNSDVWIVTVRTQGASTANDDLMSLYTQFKEGRTLYPAELRVPATRERWSATRAFVRTPPDGQFGATLGNKEWEIVMLDAEYVIEGDQPQGAASPA